MVAIPTTEILTVVWQFEHADDMEGYKERMVQIMTALLVSLVSLSSARLTLPQERKHTIKDLSRID